MELAYWTGDNGALYRAEVVPEQSLQEPAWWDARKKEWVPDADWMEDLLEGRLTEEHRADVSSLYPGAV